MIGTKLLKGGRSGSGIRSKFPDPTKRSLSDRLRIWIPNTGGARAETSNYVVLLYLHHKAKDTSRSRSHTYVLFLVLNSALNKSVYRSRSRIIFPF
jgi:hypothetical protein